jgi:hypothetical protein
MKISKRKKEARHQFVRSSKTCQECGESVEKGYHYVPALGLWSCTGREQPMPSLADLMPRSQAKLTACIYCENVTTRSSGICSDCMAERDITKDPEYLAFVDSMAKHCRCDGPVCGGVLAGGFCDEILDDPDDHEPSMNYEMPEM